MLIHLFKWMILKLFLERFSSTNLSNSFYFHPLKHMYRLAVVFLNMLLRPSIQFRYEFFSLKSVVRFSSLKSFQSPTEKSIRQKLQQIVDSYEELIGVRAVKHAQAEVIIWEEKLSKAQLTRREKQAEIKSIQSRLKEIHIDLDRTSRGEDRYLHLLTEEHSTIKKERSLLETFEAAETAEREAFHQLSNRVRASHERERERAEKTKWWSVSASVLGAFIGIIGTSIGNELRMRRLREMLPLGSTQMTELVRLVGEQNIKVTEFISEIRDALKLKGINMIPMERVPCDQDIEKVLEAIRTENARLSMQMTELSHLAHLEAKINSGNSDTVMYVGNDLERLLDQTERNLESKMKLQTLLSVVFLYTAIGVTVPLIYAFLRGS